jgi:hypothetical protein
VDIVIHNYRRRLGLCRGRTALRRSRTAPGRRTVITELVTLEGDANGAPHSDPGAYAAKFSGRHEHRTISGWIGHNLPQEASAAFADAIIDVDGN